jgi:hypothetical protein
MGRRAVKAVQPRRETMTRLAAWLRHAAFELGPLGLAGLALLACAPPAWWFLAGALQRQMAEERHDIARLRARQFAVAAAPPVATPARQLDTFRAAVPGAATLPEALAAVARSAGGGGVALPRGEYKLGDLPALGMLRYELRHPLKGSWREIFGVIATLLNDHPYLSLDEVVFKRESRNAAEVDAQLRFSLFFTDATVEPGYRTRASAGAVVPAAAATAPPAGSAAPPARRGGNDG